MSKRNDRAKAELLQADYMTNAPAEFYVGRRKYKIKRLSNWPALKMSKYIAQSEFIATSEDKSTDKIMLSLVMNRTLAPKCISLMMLKRPLKVFLFHAIQWRWLHLFYSQEEYSEILQGALNGSESNFFFQNTAFLQASNILTMEMTRADTKSIAQKHASPAPTT